MAGFIAVQLGCLIGSLRRRLKLVALFSPKVILKQYVLASFNAKCTFSPCHEVAELHAYKAQGRKCEANSRSQRRLIDNKHVMRVWLVGHGSSK